VIETIDITTGQRKALLELLKRYLPGTAVWAYGSRVKWTSRPESDLDMVVFASPDQKRQVSNLKEALEESDLPFRVDLFVWDEVPESFRRNIEAEHVVLVERQEERVESEWRQVTLGEIFDVKHGFAFKGKFFTDFYQKTILVTPGNFSVGGGFQNLKPKYYHGSIPDDYILNPGQIIVTMTDLSKQTDTLGYAAVVPKDGNVWLHNQRIGLLDFKQEVPSDPLFINYLLRTHEYRSWIIGSSSGTTVKHTSPSRIKAYLCNLPRLTEQRAIAHILGSLDDKIELNRQMNRTLKKMAQAIFKSWFIDFDPVRARRGESCIRPSSDLDHNAGDHKDRPYMTPEILDLFPDDFEDSEIGKRIRVYRVAEEKS